ncbi:TetR/AcrR family transcriptional regulator [Amycolatopsis suaedae]|uniref:TetR/AcrR family transcriptional regulator n=1 Tax=Amycolatopsis suaedae TaxID=2510978 RepID=A0A4Q7JBB5_9PSEU|nr:TetR/AcrR family transcriptional regulator [Amycolatopsis suaedae]RZQ64579.1 TetR/AcrR family transcriptional regulator [Amycolatopsis suaedae]
MTITTPEPDDLTARARIRDAALRHFGEHGFERTTIRGIAETAGVSSGLVRHHFGAKEDLRDACDEHLAASLQRLNDQVREGTGAGPEGGGHIGAAMAAFGPYRRYVARALSEGRATALFDKLVELSEQWLAELDSKRPDPPEVSRRDRAIVAAAMALSISVLHQHVSRGLGVDVLTQDGAEVLGPILLDLYSHPYLSPDEAIAYREQLEKGR